MTPMPDAMGPWGEACVDPGHAGPDEPCSCGCPLDMHIDEVGCSCALPGKPPCVIPTKASADDAVSQSMGAVHAGHAGHREEWAP